MRFSVFCAISAVAFLSVGCGYKLAPQPATSLLVEPPTTIPPTTVPTTPGYIALVDTMFLFDRFADGCDPNVNLFGVGTIADAQGVLPLWSQFGMKRIVVMLGDFNIYTGTTDESIASQYISLVQSAKATGLSVVIATMPPVPATGDYQSHVSALNTVINSQFDEVGGVYVLPLADAIGATDLYSEADAYGRLTAAGCSAMMASYVAVNQ